MIVPMNTVSNNTVQDTYTASSETTSSEVSLNNTMSSETMKSPAEPNSVENELFVSRNSTVTFFAYQWHYTRSGIRVFGLTPTNESVYVLIPDFTPYVYIELPEQIKWNSDSVSRLCDYLDSFLGKNRPVKKKFVYRRRLYFYSKTKYPYLVLSFRDKMCISRLQTQLAKPITVPGVCASTVFKIHECDASPVLQMTSIRKVGTAGWMSFTGTHVDEEERESMCRHEYRASWRTFNPSSLTQTVDPLVMSFDIECNSSDITRMPSSDVPDDKVFQVGICLFNSTSTKKYLLSLGHPSQECVGSEINVQTYRTEHELLCAFTSFIQEHDPQVITGYNIFGFDIPYMVARAKHTLCISTFDQQGCIAGEHAKETEIKWSSSAHSDQKFQFLDAEGRLYVDMLSVVKRTHKLDNYKLSTVAESILSNVSKDPLKHTDIFEAYRLFTPKPLGVVGKYCVQDSYVVQRLVQATQIWIGMVEMARTCNVPMSSLYTRGESIKVYSQVYRYCMYEGIVVEKDAYKDGGNYTGAYVVDPVPGVYDMVVPFDFASLYPSAIIAYNIDFSTLVTDNSVPDELCNVIEWEDHVNCEHSAVKKTGAASICSKNKYRFIKEPLGVIPTIIQNLLAARANTNKELKDVKKSGGPEPLINTLDKRQLSYKVSANSMYGAMGVKAGYLPFMPGAMCTVEIGRRSIIKAANYIQEKHNGRLVYGDTDSAMVVFDDVGTDTQKCWQRCFEIQKDVEALFPKPMRLAFEEKIYRRFFILTKKRYMATTCDSSGVVSNKIVKKGVLLARRDNSKIIRDIYESIVLAVFHGSTASDVISMFVEKTMDLFTRNVDIASFVMTKSVREISNYKTRELPEDSKKRLKLLRELKCSEETYSGLPPHVQLAERMRSRGMIVDSGSRIEFVVCGEYNDRLCNKLEDVDYFTEFSSVLRIDPLYYMHLLSNPIDQAISVAFKIHGLASKMHNAHLQKARVCDDIRNRGRPTIRHVSSF